MEKNGQSTDKIEKNKNLPKCGIVMPISSIDNCSAEHWSEVLTILRDIITNAGFEPNLVSDADDIGIIQKRIIQNLYNNEIVVCDVSCKNPNVMFELGIRLAFDKPTIIIKDDKTDYTFDTSIIEHLGYPRDLRFSKILSFKENLKKKIQGTYEKATKDPNYSTFLKNFGEYKVAQLAEKELTSDKFILTALEELKHEIYQVKRNQASQQERKIVRAPTKPIEKTPEAVATVSQFIDKFIADNGLSGRDEIFLKSDLEKELFSFLEGQRQIRILCGSPKMIKEIMDEELSPF
jgi:hypothetical protein